MTDGSITIVLIIVYCTMLSKYSDNFFKYIQYNSYASIARILMTLRLFLFPRNIPLLFPNSALSARYQKFVFRVKVILQSILTLSIIFLCIIYFYCGLGILLYGGKITSKTFTTSKYYNELSNSLYGQNNFYTLNFNDYPSAFVTLFCALHVSDFDVITDGFDAVTSGYSKIFFAFWYIVGVLLCLNILKSIFFYGFIDHFDHQANTCNINAENTPNNINNVTNSNQSNEIANKTLNPEEGEDVHEAGFYRPIRLQHYWVSARKVKNNTSEIRRRLADLKTQIDQISSRHDGNSS